MGTALKISQKARGIRTDFVFNEEHLQYTALSPDGDASFIVAYYNLTANKRTVRVRKPMFLWAGIAFWALGASSLFTDVFNKTMPWAGICLLAIAALVTGVYFIRQFSFTALPTARGQLSILHDKQHDKIVDKLMAKRKTALLRQFQHTNYDAKPQMRVQALQWLMENEVISETEYQSMLKAPSTQKNKSMTIGAQTVNRGLH